jgi:tetraacyldisaccharide 4'-kinase
MELLRRLRALLPSAPLFVSTATLAGRALADDRLGGLADGVFYAPIDFCFAVRRVLRMLRPAAVVVAETEIWPNLYREAKRAGCGLVVVNGRISDRAQPRYRRLAWFLRRVLDQPDRILAQSEDNLRRYLALGAPAARSSNAGNLKYDFQPGSGEAPGVIRSFLDRTAPRQIWIAGSTMPPASPADVDEDDVVIGAFRALAATHPRLLLILVPRRPERFDTAADKLRESGVSFLRRSRLEAASPPLPLPGVLLLDSIGELGSLFALDSVVFMGGSLAERGGHNILEPALFGRAIVAGPHMENFREIADEFTSGGGCVRIGGPEELGPAIGRLLDDPEARLRLGERARRLAESRRGATGRAVGAVIEVYEDAIPCPRPPAPLHWLLWPLARLWRTGSAWQRARQLAMRESLPAPVISIGSLSMGGSGKTPFVLWLARILAERGFHPGILTRGYRRRNPEKLTVLAPGERTPAARTGDEAQIFLRAAVAPVGIGADRLPAGRALAARFHTDVLILDDGYQHWRLGRNLDIVLVDALDPFGGGEVFPLGRLREPPDALARAHMFVITRAEPGRTYKGIEARLRAVNPAAPVFRARLAPEGWTDAGSGEQFDAAGLPFSRVAAFCGLANPASFWRTLAVLGQRPVAKWAFADHHRYRPVELKRLAAEARHAGAEALLTTEKDVMNLCGDAVKLVAPVRLLWLRIGLEVENQEQLLQAAERVLAEDRPIG